MASYFMLWEDEGVGEKDICMEHSGCEARISQCEKNDVDIFARLRQLEMAVWKAAGASGVVTALLVVLLQKIIG